jgi:LacI family transcriptional regulator
MAHRKPGRPNAVTLQDIAAAAGVSRSTASRAFTQPNLLRPETVDRVRSIAGRMGYAVNHAARALSTGKFGNVALVVPDIGNPFFPPLVRQVETGADRAGYAVFLGDSDESAAREAILVGRLSNQVDGFVLASSRMPEDRIRAFATDRPVVLINRDLPGIPRVVVDIEGGMTEAIGYLKQLGHRDVAYVAGPPDSWSEQQRRRTVSTMGRQAGMSIDVFELGRPDYNAARDIVSALQASGVTAAIAFDDVVAQGILAGLAVRGINVPGDFSVIGCDDILAATTHPPLTTISAGSAAAGEAAIALLLSSLEGKSIERSAERVAIGTHLVLRASVDRAKFLK